MLFIFFFFSSRRRHTRYWRDWSSDVCSSDLSLFVVPPEAQSEGYRHKVCPAVDNVTFKLRIRGERVFVRAGEAASLGPESEVRSGADRPWDRRSDTPTDRCVLCRLCRASPWRCFFRPGRYRCLQNKAPKRSAILQDAVGPQALCVHQACRRKEPKRARTERSWQDGRPTF